MQLNALINYLNTVVATELQLKMLKTMLKLDWLQLSL